MECPRCGGSGKKLYSSGGHGCSESRTHEGWCDLCNGTGATRHVETRKEKIICRSCNGSGSVSEAITKKYPTGLKLVEGYRKVRCSSCGGSGHHGYRSIEVHEPKY